MSSEALKENRGAVRMNSNSEAACDIFALEQLTGRPSILRQSQADNISKAVHKGAKVCFQTPRRDPFTKKIMSPSRTSRPSSQEDSNKALDTLTASTDQSSLLSNTSTTLIDIQSNSVAFPDDDMPVQSRGAYTFDLDNLDAINPFMGSNKMQNSAPKSSALPESWTSELVGSDTTAAPVSLPQAEVPEVTDTALDETLPFVPSVENSLAECSANISSAEGTVIIRTDNIENSATDVEVSDMTEPAPALQQIPVLEDQPEVQDSPRRPVGCYNLDFDHLDLLNQFQTGGSKIPNSPLIGRASVVSVPPLPIQEAKLEPEPSVQTPDIPTSSDTSMPPQDNNTATEGSSSITPPKENQMFLEFNFDDGAEVKRKPPPKRLGVKRPAGAKPETKKTVAPAVEKKEPEPKQLSPKNPEETEPVDVPPAKSSYTFDFDKFEEPNFDPFDTKAKMGNSPPRGVQTSPVLMKEPASVQQPEAPAQDDQPEHRSPPAVSETIQNMAETDLLVTKRLAENAQSFTMSITNIHQNPAIQEPELMATPESKVDLQNQTCDLGVVAPSEDEFVPGAFFMPGGDLDGQIDYLEQFGSSTFKESALRKQSLYLKFDPLLKESPKKTGVDSGYSGFSLPRPSLAIRMMEAAKSEVQQKSYSDSMKLLDYLPPQAVETVVPDPTVLDLLLPTLKQPVKTENSIIEVLKYSQRDMDAALQKAERQAEERQQELKTQIEKLQLENQHMLFIVSEFEATITQITDEHKQKEDLAKIELERVLQEKDQLSKDLNELERSFSSVVKRLDRCKEVIEGFKKNEETLKQYAQNCMDRLQKEEKRYQALKAHAEEKLDHANKAIAEVRTKQGAEVAALQVQLKREQLKVQSLEKDLEQKVKEVKDVTELCDELLFKVQKHSF
ncbi:transforming acidic coiled-coil-containing protein 3-like isoform X1 [Sinocyclocheilus grahami]|uniref:Transforming acidic coiled-coil-containing protein 3-like n=1 Tax=Sinocyclocheilus grahami TaxID=75366 RepID=A0A672SBY1_SINGR|nr:PREDICTED: transforming acidic coiled-coil-containing protein 3-like isoform X1 [Sinocyclocheilus grahami]XP_016090823.1 PREDICTED: transforming acidic coiled-coil-containing protein 3-like isoform X1 [Sinocyclocheilus grahami]XP_016090824.1 PREDICTED: transforming acidic coiled-coil-containing protein 3-like isoform X1 [Sinocyclocheilus grahami]